MDSTTISTEIRTWLAEHWDPDLSLIDWRERLVSSGWAVPSWPTGWFGRGLPAAADKLVADTWEAFLEAGSPWDQAVATRLRDNVLSVGNSVDPELGYRAFRGRDATIAPLLRKRGFPVPPPTAGGN